MVTGRGKFRSSSSFTGMIENLGDAYEAAEECFGMVQVLAAQLAAQHPGQDGVRRTREKWIEWAADNYRAGLRIGGRQRERG